MMESRSGLFVSLRGGVFAAACVVVMSGCGGATQSNVNVGTTDVKGSVGGVILDGAPGLAPLAGVAVTIVAGATSLTATTDANGVFSVTGVPAGTVVIRLAADKHLGVTLTRTLDGSAGNFPLTNPSLTVGPIAMLPGGGTFKVRLLDEMGGPVVGLNVAARTVVGYLDLSSGAATNAGFVSTNAASASDGLVTLPNLPDYNTIGPVLNDTITISVPPIQIQAAGETYAFLGSDFAFNGRRVSGQTPNLVLAGPHTNVTPVTSTLDYLLTGTVGANPSLAPVNGPISVVFNQAINPLSVRAYIYSDAGAIAITPTATVNANLVSLGFGGKMLDPGQRYNLELHVASLANQAKEYNVVAPVFTKPADPNAPVTATVAFEMMNSTDATITFSEPIGVGGGSAASLACVVYYQADLDGDPKVSPGEWTDGGNNLLKCNPGDPHLGYYLRPDEVTFATPSGSSAITGFSRRWRLAVRPFAQVCVGGLQCCVGSMPLHFQFSRNPDANAIVRRLTGAPVPDMSGGQLAVPPFACM